MDQAAFVHLNVLGQTNLHVGSILNSWDCLTHLERLDESKDSVICRTYINALLTRKFKGSRMEEMIGLLQPACYPQRTSRMSGGAVWLRMNIQTRSRFTKWWERKEGLTLTGLAVFETLGRGHPGLLATEVSVDTVSRGDGPRIHGSENMVPIGGWRFLGSPALHRARRTCGYEGCRRPGTRSRNASPYAPYAT